MDERMLRMQCLQQASQLLGMNLPGTEAKHTPEDVLALADKMFTWVKG